MNARARALFKLAGKGEQTVAAVFASDPADSARAVAHLREGAPDVPVWLFCTAPPLDDVAALCERVCVKRSSLLLLAAAERMLWPRWVALSVGAWTGRRGQWPLKFAPFLIPPFRALLLNRHGDFLQGTPSAVARHAGRSLGDSTATAWNALRNAAHWLADRCSDLGHRLAALADLAFLALAPLLACMGRPHWRWFHNGHGRESLDLHVPSTGGGDLVRYSQKGSGWNARAIEKAARSDARWFLWTDEHGLTDLPESMLTLLADDSVFAVSVQTDFRAWKPVLIPTAPFRTLQPKEASRVLAPLSSTILVDRAKLLALGIPRARLGATAWMILMWKAAAAGWKCYSVGQPKRLREQPDFPVQETDFILRVMRSRELRRLGPRQPELARGCIAFAPALQPPAGKPDRLRVLLASPFLPYPLSHGGAVRIFNLCAALRDRVDFLLVAVREHGEHVDYAKLHEVFREVHVVDIDERAAADPALPAQVRSHRSAALQALIGQIARERRPDVLQVEYTHMAPFRDAAPTVPAILVEHDLTFTLYRQLAESKPSSEADAEYQRWLRFERQWLAGYDGVWTVSADDRETAVAESGRPAETTFNIPNGVDTRRFVPSEDAGASEIFYVGSFRHLPNILGFEKLRREVMPRVWEIFPDSRLRVIAGPKHEQFWNRFTRESLGGVDPRIAIEGFVEDLRPYYARAAVVVVPLEVSAGTNIKVLEAMACGKPVVTTAVGCAGLGLKDGSDAYIRDGWDSFAKAVCELLGDRHLRARIGAEARRTVEERFSWESIAQTALKSYEALLKRTSAVAR